MKKIIYFLFGNVIFFTGCTTKQYENLSVKPKYDKNKVYYSQYNKSNLKKKSPYIVRGKRYKPFVPNVGHTEYGLASWYGKPFHGRKTASGEIYNMNKLSAAHKYYPINTMVEVKNLKNNKTIVLRINDRGPYNYGRAIDLSKAAAKKLGVYSKGVEKVKITVIGYAVKTNK